MRAVFVGTGGSWPSPERNVMAFALGMGREVLLFDCGEGTQRQLMRSSVSFMRISKIFVSHFHGDHFLGIPGLIQSMALNDRKEPLEIYGPAGTEELVQTLTRLGYFTPTYEVRVKDMQSGDEVKCDGYSVRCMDASHNVPTLAFAVEEEPRPGKFSLEKAKELGIPAGPLYSKLQAGETVTHAGKTFTPDMVMGPPRRGRKVVYTGDTKPCAEIEELAAGADLLVHDATSAADLEEKANAYGHSSSRQAAELAAKAKVRTLALVHISPRYEETGQLLKDAKDVFPNVILPKDLDELEIRLADG
ncbi:MAG: ribonuclease Z [Euryarchaeota archaeon]|nr:ribonuclease Z [Euryarchaeota archaeon]